MSRQRQRPRPPRVRTQSHSSGDFIADSIPATEEKKDGEAKDGDKRDTRYGNKRSRSNDRYNKRGPNKRFQRNVKTDFTALPETDDPEEIRKQVSLPPRPARRLSSNA